MRDPGKRWRCKACNQVSFESDLLTAPSPFDHTETLTGCPKCKSCDEGFSMLCDEHGCNREVNCGWPTGVLDDPWSGYRHTCSAHAQLGQPSKEKR